MTGNTIKLRALEPNDIDLIHKWENDQLVWHLSNTLIPFSRFDIEQYVLNSEKDIFVVRQVRLMIEKIEDSSTVGVIDLFDFDPLHKRAGIGILITEAERQKGYATDALETVIKYCFKTLMLHQLFANIIPDNSKSIKLFEDKGFKKAGNKKDWLLIENKWKDELLYQLINPEN